jgi:hypothetical protein
LSSLQPGDAILFKDGDVWSEQLDLNNVAGTASNPITFSTYGSGAMPVIDGGGTRQYCIDALDTNVKYVTIEGIECRFATEQGVTFQTSGGAMPGVVVKGMYIHQTGPGACCGATPYDDNNYSNQLDFEDFGQGADGVQFLNNTVNHCGGHNCLEVHYDTGAVAVKGNTVGPGCVHGCIDVKGVGSPTATAVIDSNVATCGASQNLCGGQPGANNMSPAFYFENTYTPNAAVEYTRNVAYDSGVGYQIMGGGCASGHSPCANVAKYYNNDAYVPSNGYGFYSQGGGVTTLDMRNNIFDGGMIAVSSCSMSAENYNDVGGSQGNVSFDIDGSNSWGANDMHNVNPIYVNASVTPPNYVLQATSTLINAGESGLTSDNDIGAY